MGENPESPKESPIRLPLEVRRKLGLLRLLIAHLGGLVDKIDMKVSDLEGTLKIIDRTLKAKEKALETKEDIELFERQITALFTALRPFETIFRDKARQIEDVCDRLEALV